MLGSFDRKKNNRAADGDGRRFVLTASRAEMSDYCLDPFIAFTCTFPHKLFPKAFLEDWYTPKNLDDGSARFAPYGIRKVEALLVNRYGRESVVVCHPDSLHQFVGKETEAILVSSMDPNGLAYVSTTYNSLIGFGGEALNAHEFELLMERVRAVKGKAKVIVGGAGVWQIKESRLQDRFGIDLMFQGEAERNFLPILEDLLSGKNTERYHYAQRPELDAIPTIIGAANFGMVEITRGCGRGCQFCTPTMRSRYSFPIEHIMKEVRLNIEQGSKMVFAATEDTFLYKADSRFAPNRQELVKLYSAIAREPGVEYIQISHASLAPVIYDPKVLDDLTPILIEKTRWRPEYKPSYKKPLITVEVGVESGSARIMNRYMKGKAKPFDVDNWSELVVNGVGIMNDHDWWPLCTLMTGLPDEEENDLLDTLKLVDDLEDSKSFLTPLVFIPIEEAILGKERRVDLDYLDELQWEFIARCWRHNIKVWDKKWEVVYRPMFFMVHWLYARWKHGSQATKPMMRLAGIPDNVLGGYMGKECDPEYCKEHAR